MNNIAEQVNRLVEIMARLRGPDGCPWDKEQTYKDINPYMLEEVHEVMEAIDHEDYSGLKEELGDLLMHICFHCQLASEEKRFTLAEVAETISEKLIRRHPHVFGDEKAETSEKVLENWEKIKQKERADQAKPERKTLLGGLPKAIPALVRALRIGEKTSRVGFDWPTQEGVLEKIDEELRELRDAIGSPAVRPEQSRRAHDDVESELGDLLFTVANLARHSKIDPETALRKSCDRFSERFGWIENQVLPQGKKLQDLSAAEWDALWQEAKA